MLERSNSNIFYLTIIEKLHRINNRNITDAVIMYQQMVFRKGKRSFSLFFPATVPDILHILLSILTRQIVIWRGKLNYKLIGIINKDIKENREIKIPLNTTLDSTLIVKQLPRFQVTIYCTFNIQRAT